ncbi:gamma-glutamyltransferase [Rubrobacter marinus]|uniref:gamma-glutamyltransferase n=1 Tax=Rubrobacter marinus TaxID=2653852 RepID=UPI00140C65B6|nr:gamma-glutamyltransferase [Rubrobacter marinus]
MFPGEGASVPTTRRPDGGGRSTVFGIRGAVACEHPRAALAGIRALDAGGNAADACVAMAACLAVLAPMTTGMGGDAFLLFYEARKDGPGRVLGASGAGGAPRAATIEGLRDLGLSEMPVRGGPTVTVPGAVRLWEDAANRLGRMPLAALLEPARELSESGFPVSEVVARYWEAGEGLMSGSEAAASAFLPEGRAPRTGEIFRQPDLARTIAAVIEGGADAFYGGEVARSIARSVGEAGGLLSEADLAVHETLWVEPISTDYRGTRVYEIPPPGQGIAALQILNVLEGFDMRSLDPLGAERAHLEVEAKKLAFRDLHEKIGDPALAEVPTGELLSEGYAAGLRARIDPSRAGPSVSPALGDDTAYLCAVDEEGNACSFINSLYMGFGSGVVAGGTGVALQNRGTSFRLDEGHPNALAPGKRPLHTIIPGLMTRDGDLCAVFGNMGGPMQPQGHARIVGNLVDHGMDPQEAVDHPRHFHNDGVLLLEGRFPREEVEALRGLGHDVAVGPDYAVATGGAQLIRVLENGVRACGSDPRKDGCALAQ